MLDITIKRAGELSAEENAQINEVSGLAYSAPDGGVPDDDDITWSSPDWFILGRLDGQVVSLVGLLYREVQVGEQSIPVAGLGGVATHPNFQRRGLAAQLMERAKAFMRDEMRVPFGLLVCSDSRSLYYARLGWQVVSDPMLFDCQGSRRVFHQKTMVLPLGTQVWPRGQVYLCGLPW